jgi:hypothetical protein
MAPEKERVCLIPPDFTKAADAAAAPKKPIAFTTKRNAFLYYNY